MHDPEREGARWLASARDDLGAARLLATSDVALDALLDTARELDLLYIPTRYPNGLQSGTPTEAFSVAQAERAIASAECVVGAVSPAAPA